MLRKVVRLVRVHRSPSKVEAKEGKVTLEGITPGSPRAKLKECTAKDLSLANIRHLADADSDGYQWDDGLIFRHMLDSWGDPPYRQLCLPLEYCSQCLTLTLAHEKFGHRGRNKVTESIKKLFYWPNMYSEITKHCKSCEVCQKYTKVHPKLCPMQEREVISVPSERVCIDIVGPFPKGKGGFEFLLTYVDMATRLPEAVPLRKTTSAIVINQLYQIFSCNCFTMTLVSDNGTQFSCNQFK